MRRIFLIDQTCSGLRGEYLTETVLIADTLDRAIKATLRLRKEWDLVVRRHLLTAFDLGPAPDPLPAGLVPRHMMKGVDFLAIGTGTDDDS